MDRREARRGRVLNAFRHQRKDHAKRAWVASSTFDGAQRLSASEEGSRHNDEGALPRAGVLNAFRHQRKDHRVTDFIFKHLLRAQRLSASEEGSRHPSWPRHRAGRNRCSTPFGIRGRITQMTAPDLTIYL